MQPSFSFNNNSNIAKENIAEEAIVKITGSNTILSKNQIAFNKLTEEIRKTTSSIKKMEDLLQKFLAEFCNKIGSLNEQLIRQQIDFVKAMYQALQKSNFSKVQRIFLFRLLQNNTSCNMWQTNKII